MSSMRRFILCLPFLFVACSKNDGDDPDLSWIRLIDGEWSLAPSTEEYICVFRGLEEDFYINAFQDLAPPGTHHAALTVGSPSEEDGVLPCEPNTHHSAMLYASGVGTKPLKLPDGVAVKVSKGQQLLLNLHLYNASDSEITGMSGVEVNVVPQDEVQAELEAVLVGNIGFALESDEYEVEGTCTQSGPTTIYAVGPHMHLQGKHMTIVAERAAGNVTLFDQDYSFHNQEYVLLDPPVDMAQGDKLSVTCTYHVGGVSYGDGTDDEMCNAAVFRTKLGDNFTCVF
jgi:hypothetical protein